ncbi:MAG TPA: AAA family ATPase [Pirellulales bacterium]|nr:AAA family ATPase [Pirellulales bacterium]
MAKQPPRVVVLAGPNGAGKSTSAARLLRGALKVDEFVNADLIAEGLSAFAQDRVAFQAGRIMLARMHELANARASFGFETTLATRSYASWLSQLRQSGYKVHIVFLWLPGADEAVERVAERVRAGGHHVPEPTIRRRYKSGLKNLFRLYLPLADTWQFIDNSIVRSPRCIAIGRTHGPGKINDPLTWQAIVDTVGSP